MPIEPGAEPAALARVAQPAVGGADRLLEDDRDAGRLVVVVLAPDRVRDQPARVARLAAGRARRDDQVEAALGARLRAGRGLGDEDRVGGGGEPVLLGHQPVLEREPGSHAAAESSGGSGAEPAGGWRRCQLERPHDDPQLEQMRASGACANASSSVGGAGAAPGRRSGSSALTTSAGGWIDSRLDDPRRRARAPRRCAASRHLARQPQLRRRCPARPPRRAARRRRASVGRRSVDRVRHARSSLPGVTSQTVAAATRAGSRSSVVVVVTNAWGSSPMRRTRWARRCGIELAEDVVEQQQRRPAVRRPKQVERGQLERQDRGALLAARREAGQVAPVALERDVVAVRPDERLRRSTAPSRPSRRAGAGARRAWSRPAPASLVREVAQLERLLARRDLRVRRGQRPGESRQRLAPPVHDLAAVVDDHAVPEAQLVGAAMPSRIARRRLLRCVRARA